MAETRATFLIRLILTSISKKLHNLQKDKKNSQQEFMQALQAQPSFYVSNASVKLLHQHTMYKYSTALSGLL